MESNKNGKIENVEEVSPFSTIDIFLLHRAERESEDYTSDKITTFTTIGFAVSQCQYCLKQTNIVRNHTLYTGDVVTPNILIEKERRCCYHVFNS